MESKAFFLWLMWPWGSVVFAGWLFYFAVWSKSKIANPFDLPPSQNAIVITRKNPSQTSIRNCYPGSDQAGDLSCHICNKFRSCSFHALKKASNRPPIFSMRQTPQLLSFIPQKLTWNPTFFSPWKRKRIYTPWIFRFHVNFRGCCLFFFSSAKEQPQRGSKGFSLPDTYGTSNLGRLWRCDFSDFMERHSVIQKKVASLHKLFHLINYPYNGT